MKTYKDILKSGDLELYVKIDAINDALGHLMFEKHGNTWHGKTLTTTAEEITNTILNCCAEGMLEGMWLVSMKNPDRYCDITVTEVGKYIKYAVEAMNRHSSPTHVNHHHKVSNSKRSHIFRFSDKDPSQKAR